KLMTLPEDQVSAHLVGMIHDRDENLRHNKLDMMFGRFEDGTPVVAARNLDVRSMIKRWVSAFHAALYRAALPAGKTFSKTFCSGRLRRASRFQQRSLSRARKDRLRVR